MPDAPDPAKVIPLQEAANRRAFDQTINAMRPTEITPQGTSTWTNNRIFDQSGYDAALADWQARNQPAKPIWVADGSSGEGGTSGGYWVNPRGSGDGSPQPTRDQFYRDNWTREVALSPDQQKLYDAQMRNSQGMADQTNQMLSSLRERYGNPLNLADQLPTGGPLYDEGSRARVEEALLNRMRREMDPQFATEERNLHNRLGQTGFNIQDSGYGRTMDRFDQRKDRAYADAVDRAILAGGQEASGELQRGLASRGQELQEALMRINTMAQDRGRELNEFNAFRTGSQVQMPTTQGSYSAPQAAAADYMGAYQQQYDNLLGQSNANAASSDNFLSGLMGLGGAFLGGPQGSAAGQLMAKFLG